MDKGKIQLTEEELLEVTGGKGPIQGEDWIACPFCHSEKAFVPVNGWWRCADCGEKIKSDRRFELTL